MSPTGSAYPPRLDLPADAAERLGRADTTDAPLAPGSGAPHARAWSAAGREVAWLVLYAGATVAATWPLARDIGTHLADTVHMCWYDLRLIVWSLSWQTHALTSAPAHFFDANIYHPTPDALLYSETAYGALPFFLPTMLLSGNPVLAINLMFLGSIAVLAWALHRIVERATCSAAAGCVAAGTVLTSPWLLRSWAPAAPNYAVLFWFPALIALAARPRLDKRHAVALAGMAFLQAIVSPYVAVAVLAPLVVLAAWRLLRRPRSRSARCLATVVVVTGALTAAMYLPNLVLRTAEPQLGEQTVWSLIRPGPVQLPGGWFVPRGVAPCAVAVPLLVLVAASVVARTLGFAGTRHTEHRLWRHALLWTTVGLCLMGSYGVRIGTLTIPSPLVLVFGTVPGLDMFRVPVRLGTATLPGLALLAGIATSDLSRWLGHAVGSGGASARVRGILAAVVLCMSGISAAAPWFWPVDAAWAKALHRVTNLGTAPFPKRSFKTAPALLADGAIDAARRPIDGPLLVVDLEAKSLLEQNASNATAMFASIGQWYPLVNGYGGYFPQRYRETMRRARLLPASRPLRNLRRETGVAWVLVRGKRNDARLSPWLELKRNAPGQELRFVAGSGDEMLFAVTAGSRSMPAASPAQ